ncbi:unnamed protein product [Amaranthus hypochondriacus]
MAIHNQIFFALLFMLALTLDCLNIFFVKGEVQMKKFLFLRTVLESKDSLAASSLMGMSCRLPSLPGPGHRLIIAMNGINYQEASKMGRHNESECSR